MSEIDDVYRADFAAKRCMDDLRHAIEDYLEGDSAETDRCSLGTREALVAASMGLRRDGSHVSAVWDAS